MCAEPGDGGLALQRTGDAEQVLPLSRISPTLVEVWQYPSGTLEPEHSLTLETR